MSEPPESASMGRGSQPRRDGGRAGVRTSGRKKPWLPAYWVGVVALLLLTRRVSRDLRCEACGASFGPAASKPAFPRGKDFSIRCPGCGSEDVEHWPAAEFVGLFVICLLVIVGAICSIAYLVDRWS